MKPLFAIFAAIVALGLIAIDFAPVLIAHHEETMFRVEQRERKLQAAFARECKSFYPTSPANQNNCIDEMNAERSL